MFCPGCVIEFLVSCLVLQSSRREREGWLLYFNSTFLYMFVYVSVSLLFSHGALGLAVVMFLLMHCLLMHPIVFGVLCLVFAMLYCTLCHF